MITQRRKSASRPCLSVSRPSSKTCRKRSQTGARPSRTRRAGRRRTGRLRTAEIRAAPPRSIVASDRSRSSDVGRLELAHVEPDEPIRRAEEELRERLRDLRLAGAGGADEEEDAERAARVGEAGLDHRDPLDETVDRLRLPSTRSLEEGAHVLEVKRSGRVEKGERQPRAAASVARTSPPSRLPRPSRALRRPRPGRAGGLAGRCDPREELLRELETRVSVSSSDATSRPSCRARGGRRRSTRPRRAADADRRRRPQTRGRSLTGARTRSGRSRRGSSWRRTRCGEQRVEEARRAAGMLPA